MHGGATVNGSLIRNKGKTAGLLEKQAESESKTDLKQQQGQKSFIQSVDSSKNKNS